MRLETTVELNDPPMFTVGDKVRALKGVRNDGSFLGLRRGDHVLNPGEVGYVHSIGTFLQQFYIYNVDFIERGLIVGMRAHELDLMEKNPDTGEEE